VLATQHEGRHELMASIVYLESAICTPDAPRAWPGLMVTELEALAVGGLDVADRHTVAAAEDDLLDGDVAGPDDVPGRDSHTAIDGEDEGRHQRYDHARVQRRLAGLGGCDWDEGIHLA
jgi:hypothetical protein